MKEPKPSRVTFIAGTLGQGGAERQLFYMVSVLLRMGIQCQVISLDQGQFYHTRLLEAGVPVVYAGRFRSPLLRLLKITWTVYRWRPDIVQSAHLYTNLYAVIAARIARSRSVGANRGNVIQETLPLGFFGQLCLRWPDVIVTNSKQSLETIRETNPISKTTFLLENVVDCEQFLPTPASKYPDRRIRVLMAGRLIELKRHDIFLRALAQTRQSVSALQARIVGDGPLRPTLEQLAFELGVSDVVEFVGIQADMVPFYQDADMLVLTSDCEGSPNVILEAMACGLPVVSTRVGAVPELVEHGRTGYVTDPGDVEAIAGAIVSLACDPQRRAQMGQLARAKVEAEYSLDSLGPRLLAIYEQVLRS